MEKIKTEEKNIEQLLTVAWEKEKRFDDDVKNQAYIDLAQKKDNLKPDNINGLFYLACKAVFFNNLKKDYNRKTFFSYESEIITENEIDFESSFLNDVSDTSYTENEIKTCLLSMLKTLKKGREKAIFTLTYIKGYNMPEIADKLKISKVAVFKWLTKIEKKIEKSPELMALIEAKTFINSTTPIDKTGYGVSVQKTNVKQSYDTKPSDCITYDKWNIENYTPTKRDDNKLKSLLKQTSGYCSSPEKFDTKDIGCPLMVKFNPEKRNK